MNCPKCNRELKEGHLYCEACGEEIKIVPDFEPEIENRIEETLLNVADNINRVSDEEQDTKKTAKMKKEKNEFHVFSKQEKKVKDNILLEDFPDTDEWYEDGNSNEMLDDDFWDEEEVISLKNGERIAKSFLTYWNKNVLAKVIVLIASVIMIGVCVFLFLLITGTVHEKSYDYQLKQALAAAEKEDYNTAIDYLENALTLDSSDIEMKYLLASYYDKIGETENAILVLKGLICKDTDTDINTYSKMFEIYSREGNIIEISHILSACEDPVILEKFQQYVASAPEFSEKSGSYGDVVHLKLTANTTGTIYYTVNGGTPDTSSDIYTSPIFLESGYYTVKAIFVNSYGLVSEMVSQQYEINVTIPPKPVISIASGTFQTPEVIRVEVPEGCTTYYTTDGTMPTRDSIQYKEPICMPLGDSQFTFITYSAENVASEPSILMCSFKLPSNIVVSAADAANLVTMHRFNMGGLMDTQGHMSTISGKLLYMCEAAVEIDNETYFVVYEYYEDPNSQLRTRTGLVFCASMYDQNKVGELEMDENGNFYRVEKKTNP